MRLRVTTVCLCFLLIHAIAKTSAAQDAAGSPAWQATVNLDSAALYAGVSASSRVVALLGRGDTVVISLEISGAGGKWYFVATQAQPPISGYLSRKALDVAEPTALARWEYQPPLEPTTSTETESSTADKDSAIAAASRGKIERDIKSFFTSKFGRTLPVSAFGQTRLHSRLGFDHRNGIDIALSPDSAAGRAVLGRLRGFGVPFIAFRRAIPGIATGAHIHVGKASPRK